MKEKKDLIKLTLLILGLLLFSSLPVAFFNINYETLSQVQKVIYLLSCDLVFLLIVILTNFKKIKNDLKLFSKNLAENLETSFKYWLIGFLGMVISNIIIILLNHGTISNNEEAVRGLITKVPLYMAFSTMIYAPLTEEIIFRKCFKDVFKSKWLYIIMSGITFGALHVVGSISKVSDFLFIIPYSCLGLCFAYSYYKTKNIFTTISMHAFHNTLAFLLYIVVYGMIV